jgi:hypothetical protein
MSEDRTAELFASIKKSIDELSSKSNVRTSAPASTELLNAIKDSLHDLNKKANKGFGLPDIENEFVKLMTNVHNNYETIKSEINTIKSLFDKNNTGNINTSADFDKEIKSPDNAGKATPPTPSTGQGKGKQRRYKEEDRNFIMDKKNSIDTIMNIYGFDRNYASKLRHLFKKQLKDGVQETGAVNDANDNENNKEEKSDTRQIAVF